MPYGDRLRSRRRDQTSLKLMYGRSLAPVLHSCRDVTFGLTLDLSWRTGLGLISGPFWRRFRDSFLRKLDGSLRTQLELPR